MQVQVLVHIRAAGGKPINPPLYELLECSPKTTVLDLKKQVCKTHRCATLTVTNNMCYRSLSGAGGRQAPDAKSRGLHGRSVRDEACYAYS